MELPVSSFCKVTACFKSGVTLKTLGVENNVAVEESCVLGNSGTALFISSGRVLEHNCSLKVRYYCYLFCFFIVSMIVSRKYVFHIALYLLHSWKRRDRRKILLLNLDIPDALEEYCHKRPAWLKPSSLGRTFVCCRKFS